MTITYSGDDITFADGSVQASAIFPVPVRQTVLAGPVDTNGFSAFGGSTGSRSQHQQHGADGCCVGLVMVGGEATEFGRHKFFLGLQG